MGRDDAGNCPRCQRAASRMTPGAKKPRNAPMRNPRRTAALTARIDERLKVVQLSDRKASLDAGLDKDAIRNIRRGSRATADTLIALAPILKCSLAYLADANADAGGMREDAAAYGDDAISLVGLQADFRAFIVQLTEKLKTPTDAE